MNTKIFGQHDDATIKQIETCVAAGGARGVLCADGHKGYAQPIGGVVAYTDKISVSGVGFDIACGNLAIRTDATRDQVASAMQTIMDTVVSEISFGVGRTSKTRIDHELFEDETWKLKPLRELKKMAAEQLGTVGSGNHYVDIFADEQDRVWVGVHFGSRGLGHRTATHFLRAAGGKDGMDVPPTVLSEDSELGQDYIAAMTLAGRYAMQDARLSPGMLSAGFSAPAMSKRCTTIIISPGVRNTTASDTGSCARERPRPSRARKASSAEAWAMMQSSSKAWIRRLRARRFTQRCTAPVG
jgi:RNA-splicing ligase RtcB